MKIGIRQEINDLKSIAGTLGGLAGVPMELALPYRLDEYLSQRASMTDLQAYCIEQKLIIQSVHAPQGQLTNRYFLDWSIETSRFAVNVGARVVVYHPENMRMIGRADVQIKALRNLRELQRIVPSAIIAVETFGGPKRLITPEEIIAKGLPMVLDTSHLFTERTLDVIDKYAHGIVAVHLSEARDGQQHLPVQDFGYKVLDKLQEKDWDGVVTLEYLPDYHNLLLSDRAGLEDLYGDTGKSKR